MHKQKILVLRGGPSSEHEVSMKTGKSVINTLREIYDVTDCTIDRVGNWYVNGMETKPNIVIRSHDVVFNAMHGEYGEDGTVQQILETLGAKFTGSKSLGARLSMNKLTAKQIFQQFGIKTPIWKVVTSSDDVDKSALEIFRTMAMPVIIKPADKGSSVGVSIARDYRSLVDTLISLFVSHDKLLVEEYIQGKEATIGVIDNFRNEENYALIPIEIRVPNEKDIFDYDSKYSSDTHKICPGNFSSEEKKMLQKIAIDAHKALGLRHYSRSDFIVHPRRGIYLLEVNALPGLTENSLMPLGINAVGSNYKDFLIHLIDLSNEMR